MIRRSALIFIALGVAACANDYDQFDFNSGSGGSTSGKPPDAWVPDVPANPTRRTTASLRHPGMAERGGHRRGAAVDSPGVPTSAVTRNRTPTSGRTLPPSAEGGLDGARTPPSLEDASDAPFAADADSPTSRSWTTVRRTRRPSVDDVSIGTDASPDNDGSAEASRLRSGREVCGGRCVPSTTRAPVANPSCDPCAPRAGAGAASESASWACAAGFADCDLAPDNGCETSLSNDVDHCGACGRACSALHVLSRECAAGFCVSACELGFGNCDRPATGPDDGCERTVSQDASSCGSCGNDCLAQGAGFVCGGVPIQCGCVDNVSCRVGASTGTCDPTTGVCSGGAPVADGTGCNAVTGADVCSCNGGSACATARRAARAPAARSAIGSIELRSLRSRLPQRSFCMAGACTCNADAQCNAGSPGTCTAGQCVCNGIFCAQGQGVWPGAGG